MASPLLARLPAKRGSDSAHGNCLAGVSDCVKLIRYRILARNDAMGEKNRAWFKGREILALNLMSSPGAGKTTLLERTSGDLD
jgi:hydrogenase nickel incorporation protein HypB